MRCDSRDAAAHSRRPRPRQGAGPGLFQNQGATEWACLKPGDYVVAGAVSVLLLVRPARQILFVKRHASSFPNKSIIVQPYDCRLRIRWGSVQADRDWPETMAGRARHPSMRLRDQNHPMRG